MQILGKGLGNKTVRCDSQSSAVKIAAQEVSSSSSRGFSKVNLCALLCQKCKEHETGDSYPQARPTNYSNNLLRNPNTVIQKLYSFLFYLIYKGMYVIVDLSKYKLIVN